MKKIPLYQCVLAFLLLTSPPAQAQDYTYTTNTDNTITITGYTGAGGVVTIPDALDNLPVTGIENNAFQDATLTSVTIPNSVNSIGNQAFLDCGFLTNITIGSGVTNLGDALEGCSNLTAIVVNGQNAAYSSLNGVLFDKHQILLIEYPYGLEGSYMIPSSVTSLGDGAFAFCSGLMSVTVPPSVTNLGNSTFSESGLRSVTISDGVTSIGDYAFYLCTNLTSVTIPDSVTSIGDFAFYGSMLTNVTIGDGVTNIGSEAFTDCPLTAINVNSNNSFYSSTNGVLFDKGQTTLILYPSGLIGNYSIPVGVTSIADGAFESCDLTGVTIPNSITNLGTFTFQGSGLTSVTIPGSVRTIGVQTFASCESLTNVTIGDGVTNIDAGAFFACFYLETVTIPASVTLISSRAFGYCPFVQVFFKGNAPFIFPPPQNGDITHDYSSFYLDYAWAYYLPGTAGWPLPDSYFQPHFSPATGPTSNTGIRSMLWNPVIQIQTGDGSFGVKNGQFGFNIAGIADIPIAVEACTDLATPVWTPLATMTLTNGSVYFSEPVQTNTPARFYRISPP